MHASNKFTLYGGNEAFADRQKKLFDQLTIAEKECNRVRNDDTVPMDIESLRSDEGRSLVRCGKKRNREMRQFRGKESIFKRPEGPAPRHNNRSIPDYHRNPHKWMKYSLDDVSTDDMTDRSNARTAFAFLKELEDRRAKENDREDIDDPMADSVEKINPPVSQSISFKKPKQSSSVQFKRSKTTDDCKNSIVIVKPEEKPMFLSTKVLMPEYVVGQKQMKKKDKLKRGVPTVKIDRTKEMKLNHLEEEFETEDENI